MTDHRSAYGSKSYALACRALAINHITIARPGSRSSKGKLERSSDLLLAEWDYGIAHRDSRQRAEALESWLSGYNQCRGALL